MPSHLGKLLKHHVCVLSQVHMQGIKCGGRFVEIYLTTEAFWRNLHGADDNGAQTFQAITKDVQKATRIMQILCSEAKSRKDISLIAKVCYLALKQCEVSLCEQLWMHKPLLLAYSFACLQVPQVKRRLEQLLFMLKAVVHMSLEGGRVTVGNLKHKDLEGKVIASQACPDYEEDEDEDGQDDLSDGDDEVEGVGNGSAGL